MGKIYTFGLKQTRQKESRVKALVDFINTNKITVVLDVRHSRGDRYINWECNGKNLENSLKSTFHDSIRYFHFPQLGIPAPVRYYYRNHPDEMRDRYCANLQDINAIALLTPFRNDTIVLLCVENLDDPKTPYCHREWLREWMEHQWVA